MKVKSENVCLGTFFKGVHVSGTKKPIEVDFRDNGDFLLFGLKSKVKK